MKFWLVTDATATRWLDARGRWTRLYLCAQRFRRKRDAAQAATAKRGAVVIREVDFDAFPE